MIDMKVKVAKQGREHLRGDRGMIDKGKEEVKGSPAGVQAGPPPAPNEIKARA